MESIRNGIYRPVEAGSGRRLGVSALLLLALLALLPAACGPEMPEINAAERPHAAGESQVPANPS